MQWLRLLTLISVNGKTCSFLIVFLSKGLSLCFMCSDQHVKYRMPCGFPSTSSLLLDYHVKQYIHTTGTTAAAATSSTATSTTTTTTAATTSL